MNHITELIAVLRRWSVIQP